jgi:hypothetical protein
MAIREMKSPRPIDAGSAAAWAKVTAKARVMEKETVAAMRFDSVKAQSAAASRQ